MQNELNKSDVESPNSEVGGQIPDPDPWPDAVDGKVLLDELAQVLRRFVVLPKWGMETLALWTLHTYAFQLRNVSTYVGIESPEKQCGKTTLVTVLSELVHRPEVASNISSPAFFRVIEETQPTLLIDEADTFLEGNDQLRGILNSGYSRKTAYVVRVANQSPFDSFAAPRPSAGSPRPFDGRGVRGEGFPGEGSGIKGEGSPCSSQPSTASPQPVSRLARFSCWCPKAIAAIGRLPETLADRCIVIGMQRKTVHEQCERLRNLDATALRRQCARFVLDHAPAIAQARPEIPPSLGDRAADIWEPLLALADLAGGDWPEKARQAAVGLATSAQENNPIGSLLLDIWVTILEAKVERMFTRTLVQSLNSLTDRPWMEMKKGKEITGSWLGQELRRYGVRPSMMWIEGAQARGYVLEDFRDVFRRYIPRSEVDALLAKPPQPNPDSSGHQ